MQCLQKTKISSCPPGSDLYSKGLYKGKIVENTDFYDELTLYRIAKLLIKKTIALTFRRIQIFLAVSRHLSYTKAAKELYLSQPAVSKNIRELEQELESRLFKRQGNRIQLTQAGQTAYSYALKIDRLTQNLNYDLDQLNDTLSGNLRIGASSTISQYIIPSAIAAFHQAYPKVTVSLVSGNTSEINTFLDEEVINIGITEGDLRHNMFTYSQFINDEIGFISHFTHSVVSRQFSISTLKKLPLVIRETGSGTREIFEKFLKSLDIKLSDLQIVMELGSTESIKSFLVDSASVGVFSTAAIRSDEQSTFCISQCSNHPIKRTFTFMQKQGSEHKMATQFVRFCQRHYGEL